MSELLCGRYHPAMRYMQPSKSPTKLSYAVVSGVGTGVVESIQWFHFTRSRLVCAVELAFSEGV